MKYFLLMALLMVGCAKNNPTSPQHTNPPKGVTLDGYSITIDSSYYKLWSDSSWEKFGGIQIINGITYWTILYSDSSLAYYDVVGYAGFQAKGQSLILLDKHFNPLPDTLFLDSTYVQQTTFFYGGYNYTMTNKSTLKDTASVSAPIGIFSPCLDFTGTSTMTVAGQSQTSTFEQWLAKGPGELKQTLNSGVTIVMVSGNVNGKTWGTPASKSLLAFKRASSIAFSNIALRSQLIARLKSEKVGD